MKLNDAFVFREVYGTYLLVPVYANEVSNNIISLNQTGAYIVKSCREFNTKSELLNHLEQIYNKDHSECVTNALRGFLEQLIEMELIIEV